MSNKIEWKDIVKDEKFETKELELKLDNKMYKANIYMDYKLYRKCQSILFGLKMGYEKEASIGLDISGVGDKLLFMGWHSGDEKIKENFKLRVLATQNLGEWFMEQIPEEEEQEKKN